MMHLAAPVLLAAAFAGIGTYGVLARRNAVLLLIGVELLLSAANILLVTVGTQDGSGLYTGQVVTLFIITLAAAEIVVALAIVLAMFRVRGHIDVTAEAEADPLPDPAASADPHDGVQEVTQP